MPTTVQDQQDLKSFKVSKSLEEFCVYIILNDSVNPFLKKIYTFVITILLFIYICLSLQQV